MLALVEGIGRDLSLAAEYCRLSADQDNADAQFNYACMLYRGEGVSQDFSLAAEYYRRSADQGDAYAQLNYANMLYDGESVSRDLSLAAEYYRRSADQGMGIAKAQEMLVIKEAVKDPGTWEKVEAVDRDLRASVPLSEQIVDMKEYRKGDKIGSGQPGVVVCRYKHICSGDEVAVKCVFVDSDFIDAGRAEEGFWKDVQSLNLLHHRSVLGYRGYSLPTKEDPVARVVMDLKECSLSDITLGKRQIEWWDGTARSIIVSGIALAMSYVHSQGIIHRDLKPANILLDENHHPFVSDFGSSGLLEVSHSEPVGTYRYMAPEQFGKDYDEKVDVYGFGMILYEIFVGEQPFRVLSDIEVPVYVRDGERPEIPASVPGPVRSMIESCWAQDPTQRPSFSDIVRDLSRNEFCLEDGCNKICIWRYILWVISKTKAC